MQPTKRAAVGWGEGIFFISICHWPLVSTCCSKHSDWDALGSTKKNFGGQQEIRQEPPRFFAKVHTHKKLPLQTVTWAAKHGGHWPRRRPIEHAEIRSILAYSEKEKRMVNKKLFGDENNIPTFHLEGISIEKRNVAGDYVAYRSNYADTYVTDENKRQSVECGASTTALLWWD